MRSFVVLLMLVIVFLVGMIIGIEREQVTSNEKDDEQVEEISIVSIEHEEANIPEASTSQEDIDKSLHLTQKTASVLETSIKGFYNIIVEILYQFSKLFF